MQIINYFISRWAQLAQIAVGQSYNYQLRKFQYFVIFSNTSTSSRIEKLTCKQVLGNILDGWGTFLTKLCCRIFVGPQWSNALKTLHCRSNGSQTLKLAVLRCVSLCWQSALRGLESGGKDNPK